MDYEAGNEFNFKLGKLCEKHGVKKAMFVFHPANNPRNQVEAVYVGEPSTEWVLNAMELTGVELEKRMKDHELSSYAPPILSGEEKEKLIIPEHN